MQQWVEWVGPASVQAIKNMEHNFTVVASTLVELRALATPEASKAVLPTLLKPTVTKKEMDAAIQRVVHDLYVDWCWTEENPNIHPDRRVPPSTCFGLLLMSRLLVHWFCYAWGRINWLVRVMRGRA